MLISVTYWSETAGSSLPCNVVRVMDSTLTSLPDHKWITDGASLIGSPPCTVQITQLDRIMTTRPRDIDLTRIRSATATGSERQSKWKCLNHGKSNRTAGR